MSCGGSKKELYKNPNEGSSNEKIKQNIPSQQSIESILLSPGERISESFNMVQKKQNPLLISNIIDPVLNENIITLQLNTKEKCELYIILGYLMEYAEIAAKRKTKDDQQFLESTNENLFLWYMAVGGYAVNAVEESHYNYWRDMNGVAGELAKKYDLIKIN